MPAMSQVVNVSPALPLRLQEKQNVVFSLTRKDSVNP